VVENGRLDREAFEAVLEDAIKEKEQTVVSALSLLLSFATSESTLATWIQWYAKSLGSRRLMEAFD
jgi:hypothetical protein